MKDCGVDACVCLAVEDPSTLHLRIIIGFKRGLQCVEIVTGDECEHHTLALLGLAAFKKVSLF